MFNTSPHENLKKKKKNSTFLCEDSSVQKRNFSAHSRTGYNKF